MKSCPNLESVSSVAQSCPILCSPHGLQHARLACPSPTPGACSNSCLSSRWCHLTISSSIFPFSSCLQSFTISESSLMTAFFTSSGQSIGVSAPACPSSEYSGLIAFRIARLSKGLSNTTVQKHLFFGTQLPLWSNSHIHTWLLEKLQIWLDGSLLAKQCLCF